MIKNKIVLEEKIGENEYSMYCGPQSPLPELHDVLSRMLSFVASKIVESQEAEKPKEELPKSE